jgi:putative oxidoreductase
VLASTNIFVGIQKQRKVGAFRERRVTGERTMKALYLLGRFILGGYFLSSGLNHFKHREQMTQYAASKGVTTADTAVVASGAMLVGGGVSLLLGMKPSLGALTVLGFLAAVSPQMHDFWNVQDPQQRQSEMINFTKNVALMGAMLAVVGAESHRAA